MRRPVYGLRIFIWFRRDYERSAFDSRTGRRMAEDQEEPGVFSCAREQDSRYCSWGTAVSILAASDRAMA